MQFIIDMLKLLTFRCEQEGVCARETIASVCINAALRLVNLSLWSDLDSFVVLVLELLSSLSL